MSLGRRGFLKGIAGMAALVLMPKTAAALPKTALHTSKYTGTKVVEHWFPQAFPDQSPGMPPHLDYPIRGSGVAESAVELTKDEIAERFMGWLPKETDIRGLVFEKLSKQLYPDVPYQRLQWLLDRISNTAEPTLVDGWQHHAWCLSEGVRYEVVEESYYGSEAIF